VLARHGFGVVDDRMLKHETKEQARAEYLRLACEELGTLFIKLGQMLSTRSDILPPAYRTELAKMQDDVPPLPTELIAEVIEEDLRTQSARRPRWATSQKTSPSRPSHTGVRRGNRVRRPVVSSRASPGGGKPRLCASMTIGLITRFCSG
jgi:hypothetical protein